MTLLRAVIDASESASIFLANLIIFSLCGSSDSSINCLVMVVSNRVPHLDVKHAMTFKPAKLNKDNVEKQNVNAYL